MKKFSLTPRFARLALTALITLFLLTVTGRAAALGGDPAACAAWPLCAPQGLTGWVQLIHRFAVASTALIMLVLFQQAWTRLRDNRVLLPWTTVTVILYFAQAFIGAIQVQRGFPPYLVFMHDLTAIAVWVGMVGLVIASGLYAGDGLVTFPPLNWRQRALDFVALTKPIIVALLLVTTFTGMVAGGQGWPSLQVAFWTLLGGALAAGGSGALNQYIDRDLDKHMQRTAKRPMAAGRMTPA
ncbi:MAG: UbiA family prenyltransferase, partial [Anaerolineales bacterium]